MLIVRKVIHIIRMCYYHCSNTKMIYLHVINFPGRLQQNMCHYRCHLAKMTNLQAIKVLVNCSHDNSEPFLIPFSETLTVFYLYFSDHLAEVESSRFFRILVVLSNVTNMALLPTLCYNTFIDCRSGSFYCNISINHPSSPIQPF